MLEAAALAVSLIGLFVTPIINKSIDAALKYAAETNKSNKKVSTNLEKLAEQLEVIKTTVHEAQLCFIKKGKGEEILRGLKGAIDEAEVILDLFEYESLKNKDNKKKKPISSKFPPASRLEQVAKNLGILGLSARKFLQNPNNVIQDSDIFHAARETGPLPWNDSFLGYRDEHGQLKEQLRVEQNKVIAIIGHGGMGKTHLAREVYHAKESTDLFDVRMWAHVRNKSDEIDLLRALCRSAIKKSGDLYLTTVPDSLSVAALHSKLVVLLELEPRRLSKKTCLVVIDDVWQHKNGSGIDRTLRDEAWKRVLAIFKRLKNCKVVLTTRDKVCSTTLNAEQPIVLDGISEKLMSQLVKYYIANLPQSPEVVLPQGLAERIADKLKGSPLAARSIVEKLKIGGTASETQDAYMKILYELDNNHHIERLHDDHLFTFRHLPTGLQSCLAFCSMFPFESRFQLEKLTKMWVAHGIIIHDDKQMKVPHQDVAEGYFKDLVDRSLFKKGTDGCYEIHVHIHSMLRKVSGSECLEIISNTSSSSDIIVPATVRHLSVTASCLAKLKPEPSSSSGDDEFRTVRTLLVLKDKPWTSSDDIREANNALRKFKGVKVLDLTATGIIQLPDSVGELKHLRYLGFPNPNTVKQPPADENKITKLLLLEAVYISKSQSPAAEMDMEGIAEIGGIGKLEKLQGSLEFHVHKENDKKGHTMSELEKMDSLSMTLIIKGIRAVESKEEAQEARLETKASLKFLKLDWELNQNSNADGGNGGGSSSTATATATATAAAAAVRVLQGLQPHANLRELHITRYPGDRLPTWLWDVDRRKALTSLYLTSCTSTELQSSVDCLKQDFPRLNIVIDDNVGSRPVPPPESSTAAGELPVPQPRVRPSFVNSRQQRSAPRPPPPRPATINPPDLATWQTKRKTINPPAGSSLAQQLVFIGMVYSLYSLLGNFVVYLVAVLLIWNQFRR